MREKAGVDDDTYIIALGFRKLYDGVSRHREGVRFGALLKLLAHVDPEMRFRFTSSHPKDFTEDVLVAAQ